MVRSISGKKAALPMYALGIVIIGIIILAVVLLFILSASGEATNISSGIFDIQNATTTGAGSDVSKFVGG